MRDRMTPAAAPPVVPFSSEIDSHLVSIAVEPNCSLQTNDGPTCHAVVACSFIHMTGNSAIQHHLLPREREREKGDDVFSCHLQLTCYIVGKEDMASAFHLLLNLQVIQCDRSINKVCCKKRQKLLVSNFQQGYVFGRLLNFLFYFIFKCNQIPRNSLLS